MLSLDKTTIKWHIMKWCKCQWNIPEKRYLYLVTLHIFWLWTTWYHTNVQNVFQQNLFCPESFWIVAHWKKHNWTMHLFLMLSLDKTTIKWHIMKWCKWKIIFGLNEWSPILIVYKITCLHCSNKFDLVPRNMGTNCWIGIKQQSLTQNFGCWSNSDPPLLEMLWLKWVKSDFDSL
jgi:hypothetical protein